MELSSEGFKQSSIRDENNEEEEMDSGTSEDEENDKEEEIEPDTSHLLIDDENEEEELDSVTSEDEENDEDDSVTSRDEEKERMESDASHAAIGEENEEEETQLHPEIPPEKHYTQCRRLYHCIQAVVAKIAERDDTKKEWAARRVKLLLDLIPSNPEFPLSEY